MGIFYNVLAKFLYFDEYLLGYKGNMYHIYAPPPSHLVVCVYLYLLSKFAVSKPPLFLVRVGHKDPWYSYPIWGAFRFLLEDFTWTIVGLLHLSKSFGGLFSLIWKLCRNEYILPAFCCAGRLENSWRHWKGIDQNQPKTRCFFFISSLN